MHKWYGYDLIERAKNFNIDFKAFERYAVENASFFMDLYDLKNSILSDLDEAEEITNHQVLKTVFDEVFTLIFDNLEGFSPFKAQPSLYTSIYEACLFVSLCMFLNKSNRIKGSSLSPFTYEHSIKNYKEKKSPNYCPIEYPSDILKREADKLRKSRNRKLSERPVYDKRTQWSGMSADLAYEWALFFPFDLDIIKDYNLIFEWVSQQNFSFEEFKISQATLKRIGNLYNGINQTLRAEKKEEYMENLEKSYKKIDSSLHKLKYSDYLVLQRLLLSYIGKNEKYYGINIYRLEKRLKPYIIVNEVKGLLKCRDDQGKNDFLYKSVIMSDICFPKLYQELSNFPVSDVSFYTRCFLSLQNYVVHSIILVIDELVEKGGLKEDWELFLINTINEMTEKVFYNPNQIDYTVIPGSQEAFMKILSAPVVHLYRSLSF